MDTILHIAMAMTAVTAVVGLVAIVNAFRVNRRMHEARVDRGTAPQH
jgi:hypothetical protein